ncbi:MAG: phosphotransferase family protein [Acidimicrobiales bacterium]
MIASVEGLAREIEGLWQIDAVEIVDQRVSYPTRAVLHLRSSAGDLAAKVFADGGGALPSGLENLLGARGAGFVHAPQVAPSRSGRYAEMTSAGAVVLMEHLPVVLNGHDTPQTWADLGSAVGTLNRIAGDRPFAIPIPTALRDQVVRADGTAFGPGVRRLVERLETLAALPTGGVIHGEANPSNAGRRATGELVLLDWDHAGTAPSAVEYGYPLVTCHISESLHVDEVAIETFCHAYRGAGGVVDPSLAFDAALFHALRYMWFASTEARWERIEFALRIESDLTRT